MHHRLFSWFIGTGLVLFVIHNPNQPLIAYAYLPSLGMMMVVLGILLYVWAYHKTMTVGSRWVYIPLLIISLSIAASSIYQWVSGLLDAPKALAATLFGFTLFGLYSVARSVGRDLFKPLAVTVVVESLSLVVYGLSHWGARSGGLVGGTNYNIASALLIFGVLAGPVRYQWQLTTVALVGLLFAGAEEAMIAATALAIMWLIRRDFSERLWLPIGVIIVGVVVATTSGLLSEMYRPVVDRVQQAASLASGQAVRHDLTNSANVSVTYPREFWVYSNSRGCYIRYDHEWEESLDNVLSYRWTQYKQATQRLSILGHGYAPMGVDIWSPHNTFIVAVDQVGVVGACAWLFVTIWCLAKTKWKYLFVAVLGLSLFDNYIWAQASPWWWAFVGAATTAHESDFIFKVRGEYA